MVISITITVGRIQAIKTSSEKKGKRVKMNIDIPPVSILFISRVYQQHEFVAPGRTSYVDRLTREMAEIASIKRKIEDIEADIEAVKAEINEVKAGRGIWSDAPMTERRSYLDTLQKKETNLERTRAGLQEKEIILLKQTPEGTFSSFKSDEV